MAYIAPVCLNCMKALGNKEYDLFVQCRNSGKCPTVMKYYKKKVEMKKCKKKKVEINNFVEKEDEMKNFTKKLYFRRSTYSDEIQFTELEVDILREYTKMMSGKTRGDPMWNAVMNVKCLIDRYGDTGFGDKPEHMNRVEYWLYHS